MARSLLGLIVFISDFFISDLQKFTL